MIAEKDVQTVSDMRLIALSLVKEWTGGGRYSNEILVMQDIVGALERMLREGPASGHHIIEKTASLAEVQAELRQSVFGSASR